MRVEKRELPDRGGIGDTDLRVEPIQLWGQRDCPLAEGDFQWTVPVTIRTCIKQKPCEGLRGCEL